MRLRWGAAIGLGVLGVGYFLGRARAGGGPQTTPLAYSGTLEQGNVPVDGDRFISLVLWGDAGQTQQLCQTASVTKTHVTNGRFRIVLDPTCAPQIHAHPDVWVEVLVEGTSLGLTKLGSVPYALEADVASAATGSLATQTVPSGAVMFFNLASCPSGWSALPAAAGRYLVGLPSGGTLAGTDGQALTDLEDRPVGQHSHTITDPGHSHTYVNNGIWQSYCGSNSCQTEYGNTATTSTSTTGITIDSAGAVAGTNAPYLQLLVCQKD